MTSCTGCNVKLGWKKYNFQKQWRIPGYFCKECMMKIGHNFDNHGTVTLETKKCDSCNLELYFLKSVWHEKKQKHCCQVCIDLGFVKTPEVNPLPPIPKRIPIMMSCFAAFGILLMLSGFIYVVLVAPQQEADILHVILGSSMSGAGFMLARKMIKVRKFILDDSIPPRHPQS